MSYNFKALTVLVVESSHAMFELTKSVLQTFGVDNIVYAHDCDTGFKKFCTEQPDMIIVDWLDDHQTGLDLTRRIRTDKDSPNPFVPVIMMTGFSQKKRVFMARDSGITEFIVKPYTAKTLYKRIERIIEQPRQFVKSKDFFGPDRRRQRIPFSGYDRRKNREEKPKKSASVAEVAKAIKERTTSD